MTALVTLIGSKALSWVVGGIIGALALLGTAWSIKRSGAADQRAADTQKGMDDVATASKARAGVDGIGDAAVDERLRGYQRK